MGQRIFCGADYGFEWTDGDGWYRWDGKDGNRQALKARNALVKKLRAEGHAPRCFTLGDQLVSKGGIGSHRPHIELWAKAYGVNW